MIPSFSDWMRRMDEARQHGTEIPKGGWSRKTTVPVGAGKDHQPDHPAGAVDPEPNPAKHRGKITHHHGGHEHSPGHPRNAVDPHRGKKGKGK